MRKFVTLNVVSVLLMSALPALGGWDEGVAAFTKKDYQGAVTEFQELVKQNPDGWRGHYMLGLSLERLKRKQEALHHLRKAYDLNPNDLSIKVALGRAYSNLQRYEDTAKLLDSVDATALPAKQRVGFYQLRGMAKRKTDDLEGAFQDFAQLAKLQPDRADTQYLYGAAALAVSQMDTAISALGRASQLAPDNDDMKRAYAKAQIAKGTQSRDRAAKKTAYFEASRLAAELVARDPNYENQMLKISAELGAGLYPEAVETGRSAAASPSATWLAHYYLGQAYSSAGRFAEAVGPLETARHAATGSDVKSVWRQLGFVYEKQKEYALSIEAYQNAGDQAGMARVKANQETERDNAAIAAQNQQIEEMKAEAERLEAELKALEQGGGGR